MIKIERENNALLESIQKDIYAIQGTPSLKTASQIFTCFLKAEEKQIGKELTPAFKKTLQLIDARILPYLPPQGVYEIEEDPVNFEEGTEQFSGSALPCQIAYEEKNYHSVDILDFDLCHTIFNNCDLHTLASCSLINRHWYEALQSLPKQMYLGRLYNGRVTVFNLQSYPQEVIGDSKEKGLTYKNLKEIDDFLRLSYFNVCPYFSGETPGVTCLTMPEGLTLNHLVKMGKDLGMEIDVDPLILERLGNVATKKTYRKVLMNGLFEMGFEQTLEQQKDIAADNRVGLISLNELMALCMLTFTRKKEYLYKQYHKGAAPEESKYLWGRVSTGGVCIGGETGCRVARTSTLADEVLAISFGGSRRLSENKGDSL